MSDTTFGTWSSAASPVTIEYSLVVLEEIRHDVAEGFQKLSRGGIEVGGVLYGVREGKTLRIMAIRPVNCEHASGPTFRLSERDRAALHEQIREDRADQRLEGLECIGWYVSHTRTEITLTESDQEVFSSFFAQPWQVTLVVRPSRGGNMRAGFFVREPGGTLNAAQSHQEFNFPDRLAAAFDHRGDRPRAEPRGDQRGAFAERDRLPDRRAARDSFVPPANVPASAPAPVAPAPPVRAATAFSAAAPSRAVPASAVPEAAPASPAPEFRNDIARSGQGSNRLTSLFGEPARASSPDAEFTPPDPGPAKTAFPKKWMWLVAGLIVLAGLAVAGARFFTGSQSGESISLNVLERDGQLDIQWNRQAPAVTRAVRGRLEIADGAQPQNIQLKPADLAVGKFSYKRETGDIQVRMIVEASDGEKVQEASRFLGPPPPKSNDGELKTLQKRKDELDAEVQRLKESNDQQAQRIQQLERTLKILQTRTEN